MNNETLKCDKNSKLKATLMQTRLFGYSSTIPYMESSSQTDTIKYFLNLAMLKNELTNHNTKMFEKILRTYHTNVCELSYGLHVLER